MQHFPHFAAWLVEGIDTIESIELLSSSAHRCWARRGLGTAKVASDTAIIDF